MGTPWIFMIFTSMESANSLFSDGEKKMVKQSRILEKMAKNGKNLCWKKKMPTKLLNSTIINTHTHTRRASAWYERSRRRSSCSFVLERWSLPTRCHSDNIFGLSRCLFSTNPSVYLSCYLSFTKYKNNNNDDDNKTTTKERRRRRRRRVIREAERRPSFLQTLVFILP